MPTSEPAGMAMMRAPMKPQQPRLEGWSMWPASISDVATPALALEMSARWAVAVVVAVVVLLVVRGGGGAGAEPGWLCLNL